MSSAQLDSNIPALIDVLIDAQRAADRAEQRAARDLSPNANLFDLLAPWEASLSTFFAWLLDPVESHGQGDTFLLSFLSRFLPVGFADDLSSVLVRTEVATCDGRGAIDILLEWPGQAAVAIENKPSAAFQPRQLPRYVEDVSQRAPTRHRVVALIGWQGDAHVHCDQHFRETSDMALRNCCEAADYRAVTEWIADARGHARSTRMTEILAQCQEHLARNYGNGGDQMTDDLIVEHALTSPERLRAAAALIASGTRLKQRIAADARDRFLHELALFDPEDSDFASGRKSTWLSLDVGAGQTRLYFWFDQSDFRQFSFGLRDASRENDERQVRKSELTLRLEQRFGASQYQKYGWSYWRLPNHGPSPFSCSDLSDPREFLPWLASPAFINDTAALVELIRVELPA